jgi:uncharacterized alkaline shock family protein YloU
MSKPYGIMNHIKNASVWRIKMEDRNTYILQNDENIGVVQIADDVVATIAGFAAKEVEGVSSMNGNVTGELMSKVSKKNAVKGVKVDILEKNVKVNLDITVEYGYNIPAVCQKIQGKVKSAIENMTGLNVTDVNVRIAGVNMQKNK